jgi:recombination protein RecR
MDCCNLEPIERLIREFSKLPGIGHKSAYRMAFNIASNVDSNIDSFISALKKVKDEIKTCKNCFSYCVNSEICNICKSSIRDQNLICVVENPYDVFIIERGGFNGLYHVLKGLIDPMNGVGPNDIKIQELLTRVKGSSKEIIIALKNTVEGEATMLFLAQKLKENGIKVTQLARGVPAGVSMDYVDNSTLNQAIEDRKDIIC